MHDDMPGELRRRLRDFLFGYEQAGAASSVEPEYLRLRRLLLTHLVLSGPSTEHELTQQLSCSVEHLEEATAWLQSAGLARRVGEASATMLCPAGAARTVSEGFTETFDQMGGETSDVTSDQHDAVVRFLGEITALVERHAGDGPADTSES